MTETTAGAVLSLLDGIAPLSTAEPWDNVGLLVGSPADPVRRIAERAMSGCGLPRIFGRRPVAVNSISMKLPQSGALPYHVGQTMSGCVAM